MGCGKGFAKCFLIVFNSIFFLLGAVILALGIFVVVDNNAILSALSYVPSSVPISTSDVEAVLDATSYLEGAAYGIIAAGAIVLVIAFCGCCGAIKESKCLLFVYGILVLLILLAQVTAGVVGFIYRNRVETYLLNYLNATIAYKYDGLGLDSNGDFQISTDIITNAWDIAQITLQCCGAYNYTDYETATVWNSTYSYGGASITALVPASCCMVDDISKFPGDVANMAFTNITECLMNADTTYTNVNGCYQTLYDAFMQYAYIIGGAGIGIGVLEITGIILAFCLIRAIGKEE